MLNSYNFGGYLMWAYPREKVFIDSRAFMIYSEAHVRDLLRLYEEPPFFRELERRWHFRLAVLQRAGRGAHFADVAAHAARLASDLRGRPGNHLEQGLAATFVSRTTATLAIWWRGRRLAELTARRVHDDGLDHRRHAGAGWPPH
jgi:hypothetical protein